MRLVNIGFSNLVSSERIVAIVSPDAAPIKRLVQEAKESTNLIDATQGRKTKSVIITDSELVILSCLPSDSLGQRIDNEYRLSGDGFNE